MPATKTPAKSTAAKATEAAAEAPRPEQELRVPAVLANRVHHDSLVSALAAFQAEVPTVRKGNTADVKSNNGGRSYTYDYADLSDVTEKVMPLLGRHGLSFTARPTIVDGVGFALVYELRHESGQADGGVYPLPNANTPAQQMGSAITYARRYVLCSVTGIAPGGDDDDAGAIQQHQYGQQQRPPQRQQQPPRQQQRPQADAAADAATEAGPTLEQWVARAEAAPSPQELQMTWQEARAAGEANDVLDAIASVGRRRQAEAAARVEAQQAAEAAEAPQVDPDAAEAAAVAAHEAELQEQAAAQGEAVQA